MRTKIVVTTTAVALAALVAACGGGGSSTPTPSTTISGSAVKGPVSNATVTVKDAANGAVLGTTTTGAGGAYTVSIPFTGDVVVEEKLDGANLGLSLAADNTLRAQNRGQYLAEPRSSIKQQRYFI